MTKLLRTAAILFLGTLSTVFSQDEPAEFVDNALKVNHIVLPKTIHYSNPYSIQSRIGQAAQLPQFSLSKISDTVFVQLVQINTTSVRITAYSMRLYKLWEKTISTQTPISSYKFLGHPQRALFQLSYNVDNDARLRVIELHANDGNIILDKELTTTTSQIKHQNVNILMSSNSEKFVAYSSGDQSSDPTIPIPPFIDKVKYTFWQLSSTFDTIGTEKSAVMSTVSFVSYREKSPNLQKHTLFLSNNGDIYSIAYLQQPDKKITGYASSALKSDGQVQHYWHTLINKSYDEEPCYATSIDFATEGNSTVTAVLAYYADDAYRFVESYSLNILENTVTFANSIALTEEVLDELDYDDEHELPSYFKSLGNGTGLVLERTEDRSMSMGSTIMYSRYIKEGPLVYFPTNGKPWVSRLQRSTDDGSVKLIPTLSSSTLDIAGSTHDSVLTLFAFANRPDPGIISIPYNKNTGVLQPRKYLLEVEYKQPAILREACVFPTHRIIVIPVLSEISPEAEVHLYAVKF